MPNRSGCETEFTNSNIMSCCELQGTGEYHQNLDIMSSPAPPETNKMPSTNSPQSPWGTTAPTTGATPSPWAKVTNPVPCSFEEVMSEELAKELTDMDKNKTPGMDDEVDLSKFLVDEPSTTNDMLLAQMLQHEFDREHDRNLQKEEDHWNQSSKVKISFQNYRSTHPALQDDIDDHDEVEEEEDVDEEEPNFKKGIAKVGNTVISKHDANLCARKNAKRVMEQFPPEYEVGDCQGMKMRLPNRVYNDLKMHSLSETKRSHRVHERKEHSTAEHAVDEKTRLIMYKLVNNGVLDTVNGQISTGKESVVFHADGGRLPNQVMPKECALKVFKTTLNEFKHRVKYVRGDRYFKETFKKQNPRTFIKIWAEKEMMNLKKLENIGVPCPRPIQLRKHVLVMEFIGDDKCPAPKLKDAKLGPVDMQIAYEQCMRNLKKMYREGHLVHADLSAYNMLWHKGVLYFIDVAQAVEFMHPHAMEFLLRDCTNICQFFKSAGVPNVPSCYQLFNEVTGLNLHGDGETFLQQIEEYEKNEEKLRSGQVKDYPFEFFFDKAQKEREEQKSNIAYDDEDTDTESEEEPEYEMIEAEEKLILRPLKKVQNTERPKEPSGDAQGGDSAQS